MTTAAALNLTTPVGRIVQGSLYEAQTKDMEGKPLVDKKTGQPTQRYYFALAIPKIAGQTHWSQTDWGQKIWAYGHANAPQHAQRTDFAWKITDGDSTAPNKQNRRPCDAEGFPGHWVLRLSSSFPIKCFNANGTQALTDVGAIKTGYYVQVNVDLGINLDQRNPGIYLNPRLVAMSAYGAEISFGPAPDQVGFGNAPLPSGASATPLAAFTPAPPAPAPAAAPAPQPPPPAAPAPLQPAPAHSAISAPPPPPPAPAPVPGRAMTAKAAGATYESFIAGGWTDAALIQHGYMVG